MAKGEIVRWITVKGRRVPIYEDGSMGGIMQGKTSRSSRYDDGPGTTKADKAYIHKLEQLRKEGKRLPTPTERAKQIKDDTKEQKKKYGKMSVTDMKKLDLSTLDESSLRQLSNELQSRAFRSERGAGVLAKKVMKARSWEKKYRDMSATKLKNQWDELWLKPMEPGKTMREVDKSTEDERKYIEGKLRSLGWRLHYGVWMKSGSGNWRYGKKGVR